MMMASVDKVETNRQNKAAKSRATKGGAKLAKNKKNYTRKRLDSWSNNLMKVTRGHVRRK
jgi:hypothetical protein